MKKFLSLMFVGPFNKQNIPNTRVRRIAIQTAYGLAFYQFRSMYLSSKLEMMAESGQTEPTFRDWLRYQDLKGTADLIDIMLGKMDVYVSEDGEPIAYGLANINHPSEHEEDPAF